MKFLLIGVVQLLCIISFGQDSTIKKQIRYTQTRYVRTQLNENTIVKDSTGNQLAYNVWKPKYDSGDFTLTRKEITDSVYTLKWLSAEAKQKQYERAPAPRQSPYFKNGEKIRPFKTIDISGNKIDLEKFHDKIVVINFFTTENCGSCKREMMAINEFVMESGKDQQVVVLFISCSNKAEIEAFLKNPGSKLNTVIADDSRKVTGMYGIKTYPVNVVIDGNSIVRFHSYGTSPKNVDYIKQTINAIIKEKGVNF
jgi:peroxiredoxin